MKFKATHFHHKVSTESSYVVTAKRNPHGFSTFKARYRKNGEGLYPLYRGKKILKVVDTGNSMRIELEKSHLTLDYVQWAALSCIFDVEKRGEFEDYSVKVERKK